MVLTEVGELAFMLVLLLVVLFLVMFVAAVATMETSGRSFDWARKGGGELM